MNLLTDIISINDVLRLGIPCSDDLITLPLPIFRYVFKEKADFYTWKELIQSENRNRINEMFPDFSMTPDIEFSYFLKEDNNTAYFCIDPIRYFLSLYTYYNRDAGRYNHIKLEQMRKQYHELTETIIQELKYLKNQYSILITSGQCDDTIKNKLISYRKEILWYIKNYDEIIKCFSTKVPESLFNMLDIDLFILLLCAEASNHSCKLENNNLVFDEKAISYLENYLLITSYLEEKNETKYNKLITIKGSEGKIADFSTTKVRLLLEEYYREQPELKEREKEYKTYQDLFKYVLKDARRKIRKEDFITQLSLQWNILPKGEKVTTKGIGIKSNNSEHNTKSADIYLDEKLEYFANLDYIGSLEGIDTFLGYKGYIMENGNVILEHFYRQTKKGAVPVKDECIYVMNIKDLAEMSKYSKPEIIELIKSHQNKSVRRIYHKEGWQDRLTKAIENKRYNNNELDEIKNILDELAKSKTKIKE